MQRNSQHPGLHSLAPAFLPAYPSILRSFQCQLPLGATHSPSALACIILIRHRVVSTTLLAALDSFVALFVCVRSLRGTCAPSKADQSRTRVQSH